MRSLTIALFYIVMLAPCKTLLAAESYDNCTGFITSVPAVITSQGTWCLKQDLTTAIASGNAITINTNNVIIDCNNFKLGGLAAGSGTQTNGIFAQNRVNATVRQCNIRGFYIGVNAAGIDGGGHVVEDNRFDGNTFIAVDIEGDGSVVRRNLINNTGGSTFSVGTAKGIRTGYAVDVIDNTISGVVPSPDGSGLASPFGIDAENASTGSIDSNRISGLIRLNGAQIFGIIVDNASGASRVRVSNNYVAGNGTGSYGLACFDTATRIRNNTVIGFPIGTTGCGDGGGNDVTP